MTGARFPGSRFTDSNITDRRRPAAAWSSPSQTDNLSQLRNEVEAAELAARIAAAHEQAAAARSNTKLLDLESIVTSIARVGVFRGHTPPHQSFRRHRAQLRRPFPFPAASR